MHHLLPDHKLYTTSRMRSLAVASRPRPAECIHSIIYVIMILSVKRIMFNTVTVPLVRNVDGELSEGCCHLANG